MHVTDEQIKHMVSRFLSWRLPENFNPDGGVSFKADYNEHTQYPMKHQPVGTNLLDADQAEKMVRHMVDGMLSSETTTEVETVLQEAQRLTSRDRQQTYGHPLDDYTRTAALTNALFADILTRPFTPEELMMIMVLVKMSRQRNAPKRDNLVDAVGYLRCQEMAQEERKRREKASLHKALRDE